MKRQILFFVVALAVVIFLSGCSLFRKPVTKSSPVVQPSEAQKSAEPSVAAASASSASEKGKATPQEIAKAVKGEEIPQSKVPEAAKFVQPSKSEESEFKIIYFDFNSYALTSRAEASLKETGQYLLDHTGVLVRIEGNCDERGTEEYNLVLGEQRALSVRRFLTGLGVSPARAVYRKSRQGQSG